MKTYIVFLSAILFLCSCNNGKEEAKQEAKDTLAEINAPKQISMEEKEMKEMQEEQKNKKPQENPYKNAKIEVKVLDNSKSKDNPNLGGYGYDIYIFDALYVHQPHVPAINGNRGFKTKEQAKNAGEFVAYKIRNNIMPPSISVQELDSLGVLK